MKKSSIALAFLLAGSAAFHTACNPPAATDESTAPADSSASETAAPDAAHNHPHPETNAAQNAPAADRQIREAVAVLSPTQGNTAQGTVTFTKIDEGIRVTVELTNVQGEPGKRGFHIHEKGDCSAPDATSAGGHFNPHGADHGAPDSDARHTGDFGNVEVDAEGNISAEFVDTHISFEGETSIIGRAVILHAGTDDLKTQPTGDAGARAACGVIEPTAYFE